MAGLRARQEGLDRRQATHAALIPIKKSAAWWDLAQDDRRAIFEETSQHTAIGMEYLPAIARRLHHSRDLGEPFDFLTWFEFAPADEPAFDRLWRGCERRGNGISLSARSMSGLSGPSLSKRSLRPAPTPE